jgi:hypothetical protein
VISRVVTYQVFRILSIHSVAPLPRRPPRLLQVARAAAVAAVAVAGGVVAAKTTHLSGMLDLPV